MSIRRYGLISDTHGNLHPDVFRLFEGVDAIFHAGDYGRDEVLDDLQSIAPVFAVRGNVDFPDLPTERIETFDFGVAVVTHSHLLPRREPDYLANHYADRSPRLIVFGHSHRLCLEQRNGVWVVNPGPAGKPRLKDKPSLMVCEWDEDTGEFSFQKKPLRWKT